MTNVEKHSNEENDMITESAESAESCRELQRENSWLEDWISGDLVEQRGDRFYSNPVDRVMEKDGINYLSDMLRLKRAGYISAMSNLACLLLDDLEREIRKDAPNKKENIL